MQQCRGRQKFVSYGSEMPRNWKSPLYWRRIASLVRTLADERIDEAMRAGVGFVPVYRSLRQIADVLNEKGYRTRQGKKFSAETVRLLLERTKDRARPEPLSEYALEATRTWLARIMKNPPPGMLWILLARLHGQKRWYRYRREITSMEDITLDVWKAIHPQVRELDEFQFLGEVALLNTLGKIGAFSETENEE